MYNLVKDEFDENTDDILKSINEMLSKKENKHKQDNENEEEEK